MDIQSVAMAIPAGIGLGLFWAASRFLSPAAMASEAKDMGRALGVSCIVLGVVLIASTCGMFYLASHPS